MAGHYLLTNISHQEVIIATSKGLGWTAVAHTAGTVGGGGHVFAGWTLDTRRALTNVINGVALPNRNNLPPHRYLTIPAAPNLVIQDYLRIADWVDRLTRPGGMGLTALTAGAVDWIAGRKAASLLAQAAVGNVSIEVYYITGTEMS